jgi:chemotaxis protein CheD
MNLMNEESKIIDVSMSDMKTAASPSILRSSGIGSCIAITLYDSVNKIGCICHPMLALPITPEKSDINGQRSNASLRFVENAIDAMISALAKLGSSKDRLEAKIIGGANMFKVFDKDPDSIGIHNSDSAKKKLEREGIKIVSEDTGGSVGRSVDFDLNTGFVEVKTRI